MKKQVSLVILDGWGHREEREHNAIAQAHTPFFDEIWSKYPKSLLAASGLAVGLPEGQMGNSEIGHATIGSGSTMDTDLVRIAKAINNGSFFENEAFLNLISHSQKNNSRIHVLGLISDGGVHSHQDHLFAFLKLCKEKGLEGDNVVLHVFTDGRDTLPKTAAGYLKNLESKIEEIGVGVIGSFGGRYFGMDRAGNWDRIKMLEDVLFLSKGNVCDYSNDGKPSDFMQKQYEKDPSGKIDEYLEHYVYKNKEGKVYKLEKNDGIFFYNFRADRARSITIKILEKQKELALEYVSMTQYGDDIKTTIAFPPIKIETPLARLLDEAGLTQTHISESEKFPHVTFFFNGLSDHVCTNESHVKIESRTDVATHDQAPEMMAKEIVDAAIKAFDAGSNFTVINFPNADVVGHTGNVPKIIEAAEAVDRECKRYVEHIMARGGTAFVTADHGNAEITFDVVNNEKHTAHTLSPVPFIMVSSDEADQGKKLHPKGTIADMAPTILKTFGIKQPKAMTGQSLLD
jgi:2,3-bisphosphoglycerate-independent phosphoglycerate mutase